MGNCCDFEQMFCICFFHYSIHIYQCMDNIRTRKSRTKIRHAAAVQCILYLDNKVFVSLANGDLTVYRREPGKTSGHYTFKCFLCARPMTLYLYRTVNHAPECFSPLPVSKLPPPPLQPKVNLKTILCIRDQGLSYDLSCPSFWWITSVFDGQEITILFNFSSFWNISDHVGWALFWKWWVTSKF